MSALKAATLKCIAQGLKFPLGTMDRVSELQLLRGFIESLRPDCVLDVGANRGQFAGELRGIGFRGRIISFEPLASEYEALATVFARDPLWRGQQVALGSRQESLEMVIPGLTVLSSLLSPNFKSRNVRTQRVEVVRLDQLLPSILPDWKSQRLFLKMDTQGYDLEVFRGAAGVLERVVGLQSELSVRPIYHGMPHYLEALRCYEEAGFELHNLSTVSRSEDDGLIEMNCCMRKGDGPTVRPPQAIA